MLHGVHTYLHCRLRWQASPMPAHLPTPPHRTPTRPRGAPHTGKGSTVALLSSMLTAAGYRAGVYTSPHLRHLEERIAIGARRIAPDDLAFLLAAHRPALERCRDQEATLSGALSQFEVVTALAFRQGRLRLGTWGLGTGWVGEGGGEARGEGPWDQLCGRRRRPGVHRGRLVH